MSQPLSSKEEARWFKCIHDMTRSLANGEDPFQLWVTAIHDLLTINGDCVCSTDCWLRKSPQQQKEKFVGSFLGYEQTIQRILETVGSP